MKKVLYFSASVALLICAGYIYSCKKETPAVTNNAPTTTAVDESAVDRTSSCQEVAIFNGVGLAFCGADGASGGACTLCPSGTGQQAPVINNPQNFWVTSSTHFALYNYTGSPISPTIALNCAWQFKQTYTIPAGGSKMFTIVPAGGGCCLVQVCTNG